MMTEERHRRLTNGATGLVVLFPLAVLLWMMLGGDGPFSPLASDLSFLFWGGLLLWVGSVAVMLRRARRRWWILILAPVVLFPAGVYLAVMVACLQGNCL